MDRAKLYAELERDEGFVSSAYTDSLGYWTIGIGRMIDRRMGGGITKEEAYMLLGNDLKRVMADLEAVPAWQVVKNDPVRSRVLVNMCFNLGIKKLLVFKNTLRAIELKDFRSAAAGMRKSLWAEQVGARAARLAKMMETGQEP